MADLSYLPENFSGQWMLDEYEFRNKKWSWFDLAWELTLYEYGHYTTEYARGIILAKAIQEKARCEYLLEHETDPYKREMIESLMDRCAYNRVEADVYGKHVHSRM